MSDERFENLVVRIKQFCAEREWSQFHDPKNLALSLQLEVSEVLELFQWTTDNQIIKGKEEHIKDELADVLYWIIMLSNHYNVNLLDALDAKIDKNEAKYPVAKARGNAQKYTEL